MAPGENKDQLDPSADIFSCLSKSNDDDEWKLHFEDQRQRRVPNMHRVEGSTSRATPGGRPWYMTVRFHKIEI